MVERQLPKLYVVSSILIARSSFLNVSNRYRLIDGAGDGLAERVSAIVFPAKLERLPAVAKFRRRLMAVFKAFGAEAVSIISMRPASTSERRTYRG